MIGSQLGSYDILDEIGHGGMATVYRARQANMDRFVAIKVIHKALALDKKGEYDLAIAEYTTAIKYRPDDAELYYHRGRSWEKKDALDQAIADYNTAVRIDSQHAEAYSQRGLAWFKKGNVDQAIADYNKALEINPRLATALNLRGIAWGKKGNIQRAVNDFSLAVKIDPEISGQQIITPDTPGHTGIDLDSIPEKHLDADDWLSIGVARMKNKNYDETPTDIQKALDINPSFAEAYTARGTIWIKKKPA